MKYIKLKSCQKSRNYEIVCSLEHHHAYLGLGTCIFLVLGSLITKTSAAHMNVRSLAAGQIFVVISHVYCSVQLIEKKVKTFSHTVHFFFQRKLVKLPSRT